MDSLSSLPVPCNVNGTGQTLLKVIEIGPGPFSGYSGIDTAVLL
jgi:hypothetical protein